MTKILIASPVRQKLETFKLYCECLDNLIIPDNVKVSRMHIMHNSPLCFDWASTLSYRLDNSGTFFLKKYEDDSKYDTSKDTHIWTSKNFSTIVDLKTEIVKHAKKFEYDYIFWVDSDLLVNPFTLYHLYNYSLKNNVKIIGEIFWTRWSEKDIQQMPNCWMFDNYGFNSPDEVFRLKEKGQYKVGGTGACILVKTSVYNEFVSYSGIPNISFSFWEDRAFCVRAACQNNDIWIDTSFPAKHLYRENDIEFAEEYLNEFKEQLNNKNEIIERLGRFYEGKK